MDLGPRAVPEVGSEGNQLIVLGGRALLMGKQFPGLLGKGFSVQGPAPAGVEYWSSRASLANAICS